MLETSVTRVWGGEVWKDGRNEGGKGGGRGREDDEVGATHEGWVRSDFGVRQVLANGGDGLGVTSPDGDLGFGVSVGGGEGDGAADETRSEDRDPDRTHGEAGRRGGRAFSRRAICSGVPMEIRIQLGKR